MRFLITICAMAAFCTAAQAQEVDWKKVDEVLGRTAAVGGDVHRYGFPRTDGLRADIGQTGKQFTDLMARSTLPRVGFMILAICLSQGLSFFPS